MLAVKQQAQWAALQRRQAAQRARERLVQLTLLADEDFGLADYDRLVSAANIFSSASGLFRVG